MAYKFVTDLGRKHQSTRESEDRVTEEPAKYYVTVSQEEPEPEISGYAYKTDIAEIAGLRPSVGHCARLACKLEAIYEKIVAARGRSAGGEDVSGELFGIEIDLQSVIAHIME